MGPVSIETVYLQLAGSNLVGEILYTLDQIVEAHHYYYYLDEVWQEAHNSVEDVFNRVNYIAIDGVSEILCLWECREE